MPECSPAHSFTHTHTLVHASRLSHLPRRHFEEWLFMGRPRGCNYLPPCARDWKSPLVRRRSCPGRGRRLKREKRWWGEERRKKEMTRSYWLPSLMLLLSNDQHPAFLQWMSSHDRRIRDRFHCLVINGNLRSVWHCFDQVWLTKQFLICASTTFTRINGAISATSNNIYKYKIKKLNKKYCYGLWHLPETIYEENIGKYKTSAQIAWRCFTGPVLLLPSTNCNKTTYY